VTAAASKRLVSKGRPIDYLRISLTDRCNLRCVYCMGADGITTKFDRENMLSLEDVVLFSRVAVDEGIRHIRLTGGEPLVRRGIVGLVRELAAIPLLEDLSMTTNGQLFAKYAADLKAAGLSRITFSMDSTNPQTYRELTRGGDLDTLLAAIDRALDLGFAPVKINVLAYALTENDLQTFLNMVTHKPLQLRFIEYMPLGDTGREESIHALAPSYHTDTPLVTMDQIRNALSRLADEAGLGVLTPLRPQQAPLGHGPAVPYTLSGLRDGAAGSFGFIGVHSQDFCRDCNRLRLTADGAIRSCLFSELEIPVTACLDTKNVDSMRASLLQAVASKPLAYAQQQSTQRTMSAIGG